MKKIALIFGSLIGLLLLVAIVVPLVVDVDKYRPEIVKVANDNLNGKLELGKLSLSLWGQIKIRVDGVSLKDSKGNSIVSVKDAYFHMPFSSVFAGSPDLIFKMENPEIHVTKDQQGKMNVMTLMKPAAQGASTQPAPGAPTAGQSAKAAPSAPMQLPSIALRARLGVELTHAALTYHDEAAKMDSSVKDLNFILRDISLSRPMEIQIDALLSTKMAGFDLNGPAQIRGIAQMTLKDGAFSEASLMLNSDFDKVAISVPGVFEKKDGVAANVKMGFKATPKDFTIQEIKAKFNNAEIEVKGVAHMATPTPEKTTVEIHVASNVIELAPWADLIPPLRSFSLGGNVKLEANVNGPTDAFKYDALIEAKGVTAKAPMLKAQPKIEAIIKVVTDKVEQMQVTMSAPGNDLRVTGSVVNFAAPKVLINVASSGMDLDQLIDLPPPPKKEAVATADKAAPKSETAAAPKAPAVDLDASLDPLRKNPMMGAMQVAVDLDLKKLSFYGVKITDMNGRFTFKDLTAVLEKFSLNVFSGKISSNFAAQLRPKAPTYSFGASVAGLDLKEAVNSQLQIMKNTLTGKTNFDIKGSGSSLNTEAAMKNLGAKGSFKVTQAKFSSVDIGKMVSEAVESSMSKIGDKVPLLKGKSLKGKINKESQYDSISSDFTIAGGKFSAPNFVAKAAKDQGVDLNGNTSANLLTQELDAKWEVVDTFNMTGAKDLNVEQMGQKVEHILCEPGKPFKFPVHVGCKMAAPCYDYKEIPEYLGKVALSNVTKGVGGKVKQEVMNKVLDAVKKQAPPAVQNKIEDLKKKLFH